MNPFDFVWKFACWLGCMQEAKCTKSATSEDKGGVGILGVASKLPCLAATAVGHMSTSLYAYKTVLTSIRDLQLSPLAKVDCRYDSDGLCDLRMVMGSCVLGLLLIDTTYMQSGCGSL